MEFPPAHPVVLEQRWRIGIDLLYLLLQSCVLYCACVIFKRFGEQSCSMLECRCVMSEEYSHCVMSGTGGGHGIHHGIDKVVVVASEVGARSMCNLCTSSPWQGVFHLWCFLERL